MSEDLTVATVKTRYPEEYTLVDRRGRLWRINDDGRWLAEDRGLPDWVLDTVECMHRVLEPWPRGERCTRCRRIFLFNT